MSYILDALKKSDQERKRGDVPGLQTVHIPIAATQEKPWLLYGVVVFLLLALAFVIGLMIPDNASEQSNAMLKSGEIEKNQALGAATSPQKTLLEAEPAQKVRTVEVKKRSQGAPEPEPQQLTRALKSPEKLTLQPEPAVLGQDLSEVPYLHELDDYQQQVIPDMQFAGHVYSSMPSSRSVIINNNAMSEGDIIMQGLKVEQITRNGVVFRFHDIRFKIDILQDWSFE